MLKLAHFAALSVLVAGVPARTSAQGSPPPGAAGRAAQTKLAAGDQISIKILREPGMSGSVTIDERGQAAFAKLGTLKVSAMTIEVLTDSLRTLYAEYLRSPELDIVVLRRVIVNGEVARPNVYLLPISATLADLIATAGGFTEAAKRSDIRLVRNGQRVPVAGWDEGQAASIELISGDQLIVGRRGWFDRNAMAAIGTAALFASIALGTRR